MSRLARLVSLIFLAIPFLASCGGSGGSASPPPPIQPPPPTGGPPPPPPPPDLSGTWFVQSSGGAGAPETQNCGRGIWLDGWATFATQTDDQVEFMNSDGLMFTGTVGDVVVQVSGDFVEPANDTGSLFPPGALGNASITDDQLTIGTNAETLFGTMDWLWSFGSGSCNGTSQFFLSRTGQELDMEPNDDIPIAQTINVVTNDNGLPVPSRAGWITGSVDLATDELDVFALTIAARSRLEVELSHFDPAIDDLDLVVVDAAVNLLAFSFSADSLEILEVDLDPGTYYIGVEAFLTAAPASYILSIDLNEI